MKIVVISGSPRKEGTTNYFIKKILDGVSRNNEIYSFDTISTDINGCIGCYECHHDLSTTNCIFNDDITELLDEILVSDVIIYCSPVYVWGFPSRMKAVIERHYSYVKFTVTGIKSLLNNKKAMLLATCAGDANNADLMEQVFQREMNRLDVGMLDSVIMDNCTNPSDITDYHLKKIDKLCARINNLN